MAGSWKTPRGAASKCSWLVPTEGPFSRGPSALCTLLLFPFLSGFFGSFIASGGVSSPLQKGRRERDPRMRWSMRGKTESQVRSLWFQESSWDSKSLHPGNPSRHQKSVEKIVKDQNKAPNFTPGRRPSESTLISTAILRSWIPGFLVPRFPVSHSALPDEARAFWNPPCSRPGSHDDQGCLSTLLSLSGDPFHLIPVCPSTPQTKCRMGLCPSLRAPRSL